MEVFLSDITAIPEQVLQLIPLFQEYKVVLIYGDMGVGKTTFVQACLKQLGVEHLEGSPTYSLVNEYETLETGKIYHLDLYRLKSEDEIYDIGVEDILDGNSICFIEWPEKIEKFVYGKYLELNFSLNADFSRTIHIQKKAV